MRIGGERRGWMPAASRSPARLCHYLACLHARGVNDYAWEQLYADYRLCAAMSVYVAIEWCRGGLNEATRPYWLPMLQKAMTAFDDLECIALRIR